MPYEVPRIAAPGGQEPAFRADLRTIKTMSDQGWSLYPAATPPLIDQGITLDGATKYAKRTAVDVRSRVTSGDEISYVVEFVPTIVWPFPSDRYIVLFDLDFNAATNNRYMIMLYTVAGANRLWVAFGNNARVIDPGAPFTANWVVGQRLQLVMAAKSGAVSLYSNGTLFDSSGLAFSKTAQGNGLLVLGADYMPSAFTPGVIKKLDIYNRKLTAAEVAAL